MSAGARRVSARDESGALDLFRECYAIPTSDVNARIEEAVIGASWGANGYTTVDQADELGQRLRLGPDRHLLDLGAGRGWPGIYLAARSGCTLVVTDVLLEALTVATRRARAEGVDDRVDIVATAGEQQPFRSGSFDAIVHADVLC